MDPQGRRGTARRGRTRWKRFGLIMIPALAATGGLVTAFAQGAIPVSFAVSGTQFEVSADRFEGNGFVQFGTYDTVQNGAKVPVVEAGMSSATVTDLCQSVVMDIPFVGPVTMVLRAGGGGTPVSATNLVLDVNQLNADATFNNVQIGRDASTLSGGPSTGAVGAFGQQATSVTFVGVKQKNTSTTAGTFTLPGLSVSLENGDHGCF